MVCERWPDSSIPVSPCHEHRFQGIEMLCWHSQLDAIFRQPWIGFSNPKRPAMNRVLLSKPLVEVHIESIQAGRERHWCPGGLWLLLFGPFLRDHHRKPQSTRSRFCRYRPARVGASAGGTRPATRPSPARPRGQADMGGALSCRRPCHKTAPKGSARCQPPRDTRNTWKRQNTEGHFAAPVSGAWSSIEFGHDFTRRRDDGHSHVVTVQNEHGSLEINSPNRQSASRVPSIFAAQHRSSDSCAADTFRPF